ncbi:GGDEF domain-containing protein [Halomonas getboli]|uniref:GGDEF domain-containing protein n=1 Tax=Halomonas getboli TaxID=2935862 RepID=UPI001FFFE54D|nr:sensor domain-containing diguanylate cyclase [Halomonas getboli]MCK2184739.1 sensor domain-containing diguanylate cyclase [Halomonas getboli]
MTHRLGALPLAAAAPPVALVGLLMTGNITPLDGVHLGLIGLIAAGQLAWHLRRITLSRLLLWPAMAWLALSLLSYLLPEAWMSQADWQRWTARLSADGHLNDWRPPLLTLLCLSLLDLALLARTRANLGAPLLMGGAGLALIAQLLVPHPAAGLLALAGGVPLIAAQACLLLGQLVDVLGGWRTSRRSIAKALWPSLLLVALTLALWYSQHQTLDRQQRQESAEQGQRLADQLTAEFDDHLAAMRRFAASWRWQDGTPSADQWAYRAELYRRDFRYLLNIAFVGPDGHIVRVHPANEFNTPLLGTGLFQAQPEGRAALIPALRDGLAGHTGVIELLQGQPGVVYYLPVPRAEDGRILGAVGMVVGLRSMADTLFHRVLPEAAALSLFDGERLLAHQGTARQPGPWHHAATLMIGELPLTLISRPSRDALLARRPRQPEVTLLAGLTLAYLLYLALFARHHMLMQHRQTRRSNRDLRREVRHRARLQQEVEWLATHDELTRLPNRRRFLQVLEEHATHRPLSVLLCDIDHFKLVNDRLGHLVGDRYLAELGRRGQAVLAEAGGVFARLGGEEFVACLPGLDAEETEAVGHRLQEALAEAELYHRDGAPVTLSAGIATLEEGLLVADELLQAADDALYRAKSLGRDRIERAETRADLSVGGS